MYMKKRSERVVESAEMMLQSMIPELYCDNGDSVKEVLYEIKHSDNHGHVVLDVYAKDRKTRGQLIGRNGTTVKTMRKLLEIIANQEGLRVTFDIITTGS